MNQVVTGQECLEADALGVGSTLLNGQYVVEAQLQGGGFGMTYVAQDSLERQVVIKECFPIDICLRQNGLVRPKSRQVEQQFYAIKDQFVREARRMAKLNHPNIVVVHQVFEENNTAYMALDMVTGRDLVSVVEEQPHRITNGFLKTLISQSLTVVGYLHDRGLLHRDISPDNIMVDDQDHLTLIDFGAAQEHGAEQFAPVFAVKDGYSPCEMYTSSGIHDFATDIYALGATFYYLITGAAPHPCDDRLRHVANRKSDPYVALADGNWPFDQSLLSSIDTALNLLQKDRPASAKVWQERLNGTPSAAPTQRAPAEPSMALESEIAQLVHTTNSHMSGSGTSDAVSGRPSGKKKDSVPQGQSQTVVDIFGNPIDDVDAWLEEQDQEIKARKANRAAQEQRDQMHQETPPEPDDSRDEMPVDPGPEPKSEPVGGLIGRWLLRRNTSDQHTTDT